MITRLTAIIVLSLGLLGCEPKHPDVHLPIGHPANPATVSGHAIGAPGALRPEMTEAEPVATRPAAQAPNPFSPTDRRRQPAGAHKH